MWGGTADLCDPGNVLEQPIGKPRFRSYEKNMVKPLSTLAHTGSYAQIDSCGNGVPRISLLCKTV